MIVRLGGFGDIVWLKMYFCYIKMITPTSTYSIGPTGYLRRIFTRRYVRYAEINGLAAICVRRNGVDSMYYVHPDRLGSYTHITDSSKRVIRNLHFDPWGNVKNDANWKMFDTTALSGNLAGTFRFFRGFTGHEHYADLKIINMNGRLYDPVIARFFSPDNFVQAPDFTQSYNRYS